MENKTEFYQKGAMDTLTQILGLKIVLKLLFVRLVYPFIKCPSHDSFELWNTVPYHLSQSGFFRVLVQLSSPNKTDTDLLVYRGGVEELHTLFFKCLTTRGVESNWSLSCLPPDQCNAAT